MGARTVEAFAGMGPGVVSGNLSEHVVCDDGPIDSGWGEARVMSAEEIAVAEYRRGKLAQILGNRALPPDTTVVWGAHVSYAGESPEPRFERPGFRGNVVYRQDNNRPPEDRMIASIRWIPTGGSPNAPA